MSALAYYNEIDKDACHVLRCLIADGLIAPGDVDDRSIKDVRPDDLAGYTQCYFFAGPGVWSLAARMAGWPDDRPLWTGSCPCQPFSAAGKGGGVDDPRHLWPDFFRLIRACRPPVVMGEQVAGAPGYGWFDGVRSDLAGEDFASRVVDIPACAVDAPHIRQRLYWCAVADALRPERWAHGKGEPDRKARGRVESADRLAEYGARQLDHSELDGQQQPDHALCTRWSPVDDADASGDLALAERGRCEGRNAEGHIGGPGATHASNREYGRNGSAWSDHDWLVCHDGKARRTEPGLRLLVDGMAGRIPAWRLGGNAIVAPLAAEVIAAFLDSENDHRRAA